MKRFLGGKAKRRRTRAGGGRYVTRRAPLSRRGRVTLIAAAALFGLGSGFLVAQLRPVAGSEVFAARFASGQSAEGVGAAHAVAAHPTPSALLAPVSARGADAQAPTESAFSRPDLLSRLPVGTAAYGERLRLAGDVDASGESRWIEQVPGGEDQALYQVEYSFDAELTERIIRVLKRGRVDRGHVIVLDPRSGRVLAYVSTDPEAFPPDRTYPAASLVKVVTAAAALHHAPDEAREPCLYRGNQYRLSRGSVERPTRGHRASLERALATSNNRCFAQLAVHTVGGDAMLDAISRFGWLDPPAPGHPAGSVEFGEDEYDLGRLGCGLSGCRITPMHAAQLAGVLANGEMYEPWWVDRVIGPDGRSLPLPRRPSPRRVMSQALTDELRGMMVRTTTHGTARSAFRDRRGLPKLGPVRVAGKTGNLTGSDPYGRYEWFIGAAPAEEPTVAIAVLQLQSNLWWSRSSELAANVLAQVFCEERQCSAAHAERLTGDLGAFVTPILLSEAPHE